MNCIEEKTCQRCLYCKEKIFLKKIKNDYKLQIGHQKLLKTTQRVEL